MSEGIKQFKSLEEYVKYTEGTRPLHRILISNNGIAAIKFIRSVRRWSYSTFNNERTIKFVAMATPEDLNANAEYIRSADEVCHVPGGSNVNNYANVNLIVQLAQQYKVDAVWAGWGHASENPALPNTLEELGIVFIGPSGAPMYALGDKIGSTIIAQSAKVPTIAWNGDGLTVNYKEEGTISDEMYQKANVKTVEQARSIIEKLGVPVMIKASEGGGGKGIRVVDDISNTEAAFRQVQSELPGSPVFIMKLSSGARHLEVQLLADAYGQAICLNGRDCSVQRRHQKILEEGPPTAADPKVWLEMEKAAIRLAKEVGYCNAGTVEYLYDGNDNYYFLELNPRLQVEHPVTEMVTQTNLPSMQVQVAMGIPLHRIPDIRKFFQQSDIYAANKIDFDGKYAEIPTCKSEPHGHTIAARITAENPFEGFQPTSGAITEINFRSLRNVWGYFSVDSSGRVHEYADSQIGHVFAWGETRDEARHNLQMALQDLTIRGEIRTTIEYLKDLIQVPEYVQNKFDTAWLDKRIKANIDIPKIDPLIVILVGAVITGSKVLISNLEEYRQMLERGQLPSPSLLIQKHAFELIYEDVKYHLSVSRTGEISYQVNCNDHSVDIELRNLADGGFLILMGGQSHVAYTKSDIGAQRFLINGQTCLFADEYDPTQMRAQMGGKLLRYLAEDGSELKKGEPFAEIEVMKMNMSLSALEDGIISQIKPEGSVMEPGDVICTMELSDPSKVRRAETYKGGLPHMGEPWPQALSNMPHETVKRTEELLNNVMSGYDVNPARTEAAFHDLQQAVMKPMFPILEVEKFLSSHKNMLPSDLVGIIDTKIKQIHRVTSASEYTQEINMAQNFAQQIFEECSKIATEMATPALIELKALVEKYIGGLDHFYAALFANLVGNYVSIESKFAELEMSDSADKDDLVHELRALHSSDLPLVVSMSLAYYSRKHRDALVIKILKQLKKLYSNVDNSETQRICMQTLEKVAGLQGQFCADVALEARLGLIEIEHSYSEVMIDIAQKITKVASGDKEVLKELKSTENNILNHIMDIIVQPSVYGEKLRLAAMEVYIQHVYSCYKVVDINTSANNFTSQFTFTSQKSDAVEMTAGKSGMRNVSSMEDLSALLSPGSSTNLFEMAKDDSKSEEMTETSSIGMELDDTFSASKNKLPKMTNKNSLRKPIPRSESIDETNSNAPTQINRKGLLIYFNNRETMEKTILEEIKHSFNGNDQDISSAVHVIFADDVAEEGEFSSNLENFVTKNKDELRANGIRRITFAVINFPENKQKDNAKASKAHGAYFFTFRNSKNFQEDSLVRNVETPLAFQLELQRLSNFNIRPVQIGRTQKSQVVHVYEAIPKDSKKPAHDKRYFVRAVVRQADKLSSEMTSIGTYDAFPGPERVFVQALRALETVQAAGKKSVTRKNHIFLSLLNKSMKVGSDYIDGILRTLHRRYAKRLFQQNVVTLELRLFAELAEGAPTIPIRVVASNPTGFALNIDTYVEATDGNDEDSIFYSLNDKDGGLGGAMVAMGFGTSANDDLIVSSDLGKLHGLPLDTPYELSDPFDERRARATAAGTTFCYDFPELFTKSLEYEWLSLARDVAPAPLKIPAKKSLALFEEFVLDDEFVGENDQVQQASHGLNITTRAPGRNKIGMVAWKVTLKTPQFPNGRVMVIIANDITFKVGSFGTREDELFNRVSLYARSKGMPRIYIAANSGARIGLAEEVKRAFKVKWLNESDPTKGFDYFYLSEEDYDSLGPEGRKSVVGSKVGNHYRIDAIVGESPDLGVENLRGSGTIAGETARAYNESFTLSYVSCRSVGIGSYLNRLGQRVIQKGNNAPILLTGFGALNSLMGRDIYTSNLQLGGTKIMYGNGVSHHSVRHDLEGVSKIISWLSYVPEKWASALPYTPLVNGETIERAVVAHPKLLPDQYDPRLLLTGYNDSETQKWIPGFFDKNSFQESLGGWAKSVIVGRARLGGIPMGTIISEIRTVEARAPADPAAPNTTERVWHQAGQVWFPDSSFKTAQAIEDFNRENLPLMLFANWRGFSGGTRDMMDMVLKFGAQIVDALVDFKQPIFVHLPPGGELRGGAWVVVDPTINPEVMEMTADENARGGVLEAPGAASVKFRKKDLLISMHRLDQVLLELSEKLKSCDGDSERQNIQTQISERENKLMPVYRQIAIQFADNHDKPQRMLAKGVIKNIVPWEQSRTYFYNRLNRRLSELRVTKQIEEALSLGLDNKIKANEDLPKAEDILENLLNDLSVDVSNDKAVAQFLDSTAGVDAINTHCATIKESAIAKQVLALGEQSPNAILQGMISLITSLQQNGRIEERDQFVWKMKLGLLHVKDNLKDGANQ